MSETIPEYEPPVRKHGRFHISLVWLVPLVAALVGLSMLVHSWLNVGPTIVISFQTAEGLEANSTQVKFKSVVIGKVTDIALSEDHSHVDATIELKKSAEAFTHKDSRFWVVRPRIGASGVSGISTVLSGAFIGADAGSSEETARFFKGLEVPPPVTLNQSGKHFVLHTTDLGSLYVGAPIYYRRIPVGQVISYNLAKDGKGVDVNIFIDAPNDRFVIKDSRFWNASGIDMSISTEGLKVNTQSLSTVIQGGIAFVEPEYSPNPQPAKANDEFKLFPDKESALAPPDGQAYFIQLHFDHSVRGLTMGAPTEFHGVNLGRVVSINLNYDVNRHRFETLVGILVYPQRLGLAYEHLIKDKSKEEDGNGPLAHAIAGFVAHGLRAEARTANLLTGQLYINLDFVKDAPPVHFDVNKRPIEIPTVSSGFDEMQAQVQSVLKKIEKMPLDQIGINLNKSLLALQQTLNQVNGQFLPEIEGTLQNASSAIKQLNTTLERSNQALADDSPQSQQLQNTLEEVQRALRSIRALSDYLNRHPGALIRGRTGQAQPDYHATPSRAPLEP